MGPVNIADGQVQIGLDKAILLATIHSSHNGYSCSKVLLLELK